MRLCVVLGFVLVVVAGCGKESDLPETAPVIGTVTYKGKPVIGGTVTFHPQSGPGNPAVGDISRDGTYSLTTYEQEDGAVLGKHNVTVEVFPGQAGGVADALPGTEDRLPSPIPKKYRTPGTSPLEFEVKQGDNVADLKLED